MPKPWVLRWEDLGFLYFEDDRSLETPQLYWILTLNRPLGVLTRLSAS